MRMDKNGRIMDLRAHGCVCTLYTFSHISFFSKVLSEAHSHPNPN